MTTRQDLPEFRIEDSNFNAESLNALNSPSGLVRFDFSAVHYVTSLGIRDWIKWLEQKTISPVYVRCSPAVVMQFNLIGEFFIHEGSVESLQVPFSCDRCDTHEILEIVEGNHFHLGVKVKPIPCPQCPSCGEAMQSDYELSQYLYFVEEFSSLKHCR